MGKAWFKPKSHAIGATPDSWEGWAVIAAFAVVELYLVYRMILAPILRGQPPAPGQILWFVVLTFALTAILIAIAWLKTDGDWRWRWGGDPE